MKYLRRLSLAHWIVISLASLTALVAWGSFVLWRAINVDYSRRPTANMFASVLRQPVPPGVSKLRVAGHGVMMGHMVWMRAHATPAALSAILKNPRLEIQEPPSNLTWVTREQVLGDADAKAIGWDEVLQRGRIESYQFGPRPQTGHGWVGEIVIDRARGEFFVCAGLL